jgi:hypothetical protein
LIAVKLVQEEASPCRLAEVIWCYAWHRTLFYLFHIQRLPWCQHNILT